jgi:hypothetical protein
MNKNPHEQMNKNLHEQRIKNLVGNLLKASSFAKTSLSKEAAYSKTVESFDRFELHFFFFGVENYECMIFFYRWFRSQFKSSISFRREGLIFDYFIDSVKEEMVHISKIQVNNTVIPEIFGIPEIVRKFFPLFRLYYVISLLTITDSVIMVFNDVIIDGISCLFILLINMKK